MNARVLVVDDDLTIGEVVGDYLRDAGLETRHAADGQSALSLAEEWAPDLVVLDLMLPGIDGLEVSLGGTVAIPADPGLALMAGLPEVEDQIAAADVLRGSDRTAMAIFTGSVARAVAARRFTAIITELGRDLRGFPADLPRYYRRCPPMPLAGLPPAPFRPGAGQWTVTVWLPAGRGSCAAAVRALDGQVTGN